MSLRPFRDIHRKKTKVINVGDVKIGGDNPISTYFYITNIYNFCFFSMNVSKVSIVGVGMITTPGITYRMFQALALKKINIMVISTSEIKISVLVSNKHVKKAIAVLHKEFKLD